ncbi:hypothetical protein ABPG72_016316 [Tetrahymena utriculariae]
MKQNMSEQDWLNLQLETLRCIEVQLCTVTLNQSEIVNKNQFEDLGISFIAEKGLAKLQNVQELYLELSENFFYEAGAMCLSFALGKNLKILKINLYSNMVGDIGLKNLSKGFEQNQTLQKLSLILDQTYIANQGISELGSSLQKLPKLQILFLSLSYYYINDEGITKFGESLEQCQNLQNLNAQLQANKIKFEGEYNFSQSLKNCSKFTILKLYVQFNAVTQIERKLLNQIAMKSKQLVKFLFVNVLPV